MCNNADCVTLRCVYVCTSYNYANRHSKSGLRQTEPKTNKSCKLPFDPKKSQRTYELRGWVGTHQCDAHPHTDLRISMQSNPPSPSGVERARYQNKTKPNRKHQTTRPLSHQSTKPAVLTSTPHTIKPPIHPVTNFQVPNFPSFIVLIPKFTIFKLPNSNS